MTIFSKNDPGNVLPFKKYDAVRGLRPVRPDWSIFESSWPQNINQKKPK